jgi:agmatinase
MCMPKPQRKTDFGAYDPGDIAVDNGNIFSLPFTAADASVVILPVPWQATVSYRTGTSAGPEALRLASRQVDLHDAEMGDIWQYGIYMPARPADIYETGMRARSQAETILDALARGESPAAFAAVYADIEKHFEGMYARIEAETSEYLQQGRIVGLAGGDHSVTLGALRAYARRFGSFGILHIDAHADLRSAYEGFRYSHASIMHNALALPQVERIVQVGIRDFCRQEADLIAGSGGRVRLYTDDALKSALFQGKSWETVCSEIVGSLPGFVYVSFDIDGLDPALCPATGTPVPGGLSFSEAAFLLKKIKESGRKIVGFDLVEVAGTAGDDTWDSIVGARLIYKLCGYAIVSCADRLVI